MVLPWVRRTETDPSGRPLPVKLLGPHNAPRGQQRLWREWINLPMACKAVCRPGRICCRRGVTPRSKLRRDQRSHHSQKDCERTCDRKSALPVISPKARPDRPPTTGRTCPAPPNGLPLHGAKWRKLRMIVGCTERDTPGAGNLLNRRRISRP